MLDPLVRFLDRYEKKIDPLVRSPGSLLLRCKGADQRI